MFAKFLSRAAIAATLLFSTAAFAQQKIAVVDIQAVLQAMPQLTSIGQKIEEEFKDQITDVQRLQKDGEFYVEKLQRDAATMSEAEKEALQQQILEVRQELQQKAQPLQQNIRSRENEERNKLLLRIKGAIDQVAETQKFDLVLNATAVPFADPAHDISEEVLAIVSKD